jgi:predicted nuclease with TOPRIM domain
MPTNKQEEVIQSNGWTKYQQLVLNELQRHESKQDAFQNELINLRVSQTKLEVELRNISKQLDTVLSEISTIENSLTSKVSTLNKEREELSSDVKLIKWKISAFATTISTAISLGAQFFIKFLLHN